MFAVLSVLNKGNTGNIEQDLQQLRVSLGSGMQSWFHILTQTIDMVRVKVSLGLAATGVIGSK